MASKSGSTVSTLTIWYLGDLVISPFLLFVIYLKKYGVFGVSSVLIVNSSVE